MCGFTVARRRSIIKHQVYMMKWEEMQQDIYPVPFRIKRRSDIYFFLKSNLWLD